MPLTPQVFPCNEAADQALATARDLEPDFQAQARELPRPGKPWLAHCFYLPPDHWDIPGFILATVF